MELSKSRKYKPKEVDDETAPKSKFNDSEVILKINIKGTNIRLQTFVTRKI
jgi:hypothetical protein